MIFSNNAPDIALILGFLTVAIFFRTIYTIISRWFYAQKDSTTPLIVSVFTIAFNIWLAYVLSRPSAYGLAGLALAQSIVAGVEVAILSIIMLVRDHKLFDREFWGGVWRIVSITGFSMVAGSTMAALYPLGIEDGALTVTTKLCFITLVTFTVHVGLSSLFGLEEVRPFFERVRRLAKLALRPIKM
jgi:peptidoglycan biosynthesis protein MviN/MurJ (putative lipid II flippase)